MPGGMVSSLPSAHSGPTAAVFFLFPKQRLLARRSDGNDLFSADRIRLVAEGTGMEGAMLMMLAYFVVDCLHIDHIRRGDVGIILMLYSQHSGHDCRRENEEGRINHVLIRGNDNEISPI